MNCSVYVQASAFWSGLFVLGCASASPSKTTDLPHGPSERASAQEARPSDPNEALKWLETGRTLSASGDTEGALDAFELSIKANHNQGFAYLEWALVAQDVGIQDDEIIVHFEKATQALPANPRVHYLYGFFLESIEQTAEAILRYEKAVSLRPEYVEARSRLGAAYYQQHQWDKAVLHYEWVLKHHASDIPALIALADMAEASGDLQAAETYLRGIVKHHRRHPGHHLRLIRFFERHGEAEKAAHAKRQLQLVAPKNERKLRHLKKSSS